MTAGEDLELERRNVQRPTPHDQRSTTNAAVGLGHWNVERPTLRVGPSAFEAKRLSPRDL